MELVVAGVGQMHPEPRAHAVEYLSKHTIFLFPKNIFCCLLRNLKHQCLFYFPGFDIFNKIKNNGGYVYMPQEDPYKV